LTDGALAAALAGHRVLLAYGLLGEVMAGLRRFGIDYMGAQLDWLCNGLGLAASVVRLPTAAPVETNGARLAAELAADPRPALLITHSKGGLEALAALLHPEAAARCRGLLALQSPFLGSPVADALIRRRMLHRAAGGALEALKLGSGQGLLDLTTISRTTWMAEHAEAVAALLARIPVLTAATVLARNCPWPDRRYLPLAHWVERQAGPNDGLVPVSSALLPGAMQVVLPGAHRTLVAEARGRDPVGQLRSLLGRLLLPVSTEPA
jgi:hypothetical protein